MSTATTNRVRLVAMALTLSAVRIVLADPVHLGPLFDQSDLTLSPGTTTEAIGPFFQSQESPTLRQWAIPPLFSHVDYTNVDGEERDFLYPLLTYDRYGTEYRWQFMQLLNFSGGPTQQDPMVRRFYVFPLYFQQRSPETEENYTALFPFYGTIKHKLMRDEVHFVMFPLYGQSRKKDVVTDNYLFPLFHLRRGDGLRGWQFWPLAGSEHKDITTRTNDFGTVENVGGHDKAFALWPFYFQEHTGVGTDNPVDYHAFVPFFSLSRSPKRDMSSYVWPLFNYTDDREQKYREWDFPWPIWVIARGEGKTITRFIPFYSYGRTATMDSVSYLWPLYRCRHQSSPVMVRDRVEFAIWLYSRVDEKNVPAGTTMRRTDCWPLLTYRRSHNGNERLQILSLIEPILPANKSIERNWSPLWSLWRSERNAATGATSQSFLWNLYRRDTTSDTRKVSLLLGLFHYRSTPEEKRWRILFIPITKKNAPTK